jgi:uncharacterized protein Yka (UPF0111/DUF47 family)
MPRFRFLPSREDHLSLLSHVTILIGDAAHLLVEMFDERGVDPKPQVVHIEAIKRQCDEITRNISRSLTSTIITALDREDLYALAVALGDLMGLIEVLSREAISAENSHTLRMQQLATVIREMAGELNALVSTIPRAGDIGDRARVIRRLERQGREIYSEGMSSLFSDGSTPQTAIMYNELYANLALTITSCRNVGKLMHLIAIKNV